MMEWSALIVHYPSLYYVALGLISVCVGSFLNVVIYRLPLMLLQPDDTTSPVFNLCWPPSACPHCGHRLSWFENIPVISWLVLQGRCRGCQAPISIRYVLVEVCTGLSSVLTLALLPLELSSVFALGLVWTLIALSVIDVKHFLLPDDLTLPLLWAGLLYQVAFFPANLTSAVLGAVLGYLSLWSVFWGFKWATGKEGMGYGDFKLFAALGAWLGWQALPLLLLIACCLGIVAHLLLGRQRQPSPFGPVLALAGWMMLVAGEPLLQAYWTLFRV